MTVEVESEALLGVVHAHICTRPTLGQKESLRWIQGSRVAGKLLGGAARLVVVGDRESDICPHFAGVPWG